MNTPVPSIDLGEAIKRFFSNYANFNGRARRSEYWWVFLFSDLVFFSGFLIPLIPWLVMVAMLIPSISLLVRRLHDTGRSGWWLLAIFIPVVGIILQLVWCLQDSGPDNQWGPNPKGMSASAPEQAPSPGYNPPMPDPNYYSPMPAPSDAPVQSQILLKVQSGPMAGQQFPLEEGKVVTVGRDPNRCDIALPGYPKVSGAHCRIQYKNGSVALADTNSSNGTFVNGVRQVPGQPVSVPSPVTIQLGDPNCTIII